MVMFSLVLIEFCLLGKLAIGLGRILSYTISLSKPGIILGYLSAPHLPLLKETMRRAAATVLVFTVLPVVATH